ncbi:hypothetical protein GCM10023169_29060 [Georgenia halophila]|uniref:Secreted protein n=1 Tax=Georgenia halophila TaxID=620889 RepID=A0ABP8LFV0_9MICO
MPLRRLAARVLALSVLFLALVAPATAQAGELTMPPPSKCGNHFDVINNGGANYRVVGTELYVFSSDYMLVYVSASGDRFGAYNASPYGGANFTFEIENSWEEVRPITISLTNSSNTRTLCSQTYWA